MSQRMNPSYNGKLNGDTEAITLVRHLPSRPPASSIYANNIVFDKSDLCFWHVIKQDNKWIWERVTYGINRQYVLPIHLLTDTFTIDQVVDALDTIIYFMKTRYNDVFEPLVKGDDGATEINCILKYNEIATYVNHVCGTELEMASPKADGTTARDFGTKYMNRLIEVLNPHADEGRILDQFVDLLAGLDPTDDAKTNLSKVIELAKSFKKGKVS